jgi:hypothetical protein
VNEKFRSVISHSQDDKVKIIYSWFGPKGPLWNTELPNILTFASTAEGVPAYMESRNFWTDDIWEKQFSKATDKYELMTVPGLKAGTDDNGNLTPFIYPYSMTWRQAFVTYFQTDNGLFEFSHLPNELRHLMRHFNGYILIDHSVEAFMSDTELSAMHSYFKKVNGIPMYKVIYLTGAINATSIYDRFCERNNIPNDPQNRMHVIPYASSREIFHNFLAHGFYSEHGFSGETGQVPLYDYDVNRQPEKLFLSWNRRFRQHRTSLALLLEKHNLVEKTLMSFAKEDQEGSNFTFDDDALEDTTGPDGIMRVYNKHSMHIEQEVAERFSARLPLVIDGETNINKMCEDFGHTKEYYEKTLVSLITETNFDVDECTLTEKSFKPLYNKHPFIIIGVAGAIKGLQDLGFKTFSDFWSEEYDTLLRPEDRFEAIEKIILEIASWAPHQILDFKNRVKPILEHNYEMFREPGSIAVVNNIYKHITDNFNQEGEFS